MPRSRTTPARVRQSRVAALTPLQALQRNQDTFTADPADLADYQLWCFPTTIVYATGSMCCVVQVHGIRGLEQAYGDFDSADFRRRTAPHPLQPGLSM